MLHSLLATSVRRAGEDRGGPLRATPVSAVARVIPALVFAILLAGQGRAAAVSASEPASQGGGLAASALAASGGPAHSSPITLPLVEAGADQGAGSVATTLYVANHSDAATVTTIRFRDGAGADLVLQVAPDPLAPEAGTVGPASNVRLDLVPGQVIRVPVTHQGPSVSGWAEITSEPPARLSASAAASRTLANGQRDFSELPSAARYRRAWLVVDGTSGFSTEVIIVSPDAERTRSFRLRFLSDPVACEASMDIRPMGRVRQQIAAVLPCSSGRLGIVEVQGYAPFAGIARASHAEVAGAVVRPLAGIRESEHTPLEIWTVAEGTVQFEHLSTGACLDLNPRMLVGVSYTVQASAWQRREHRAAEWITLPETMQTGKICAHSPTEPGEYRGEAMIAIDGVEGLYSSANSITVVPAGLPAGGALTQLGHFTLSQDGIAFGPLETAGCADVSAPISFEGSQYEIHSSTWQRRDDASQAWSDVAGTARTTELCSYSPSEPGQYRMVAVISVDGQSGAYASANLLAGPTRSGGGTPGAVAPGAEECSDLTGCFVPLPPGEFVMGSDSDDAADDETPLTTVRISEGFQIGKHELTLERWVQVMGPNIYDNDECGANCPASVVSFGDVEKYLDALNARVSDFNYRLPTEAEWEYAARAGTTGDRYGELDQVAWYASNSQNDSHPVGLKLPNAWGLHDMLGNVYEWVSGWYGEYPGGTVTDPTGPASGTSRIARGGSWLQDGSDSRAPERRSLSPGYRLPYVGFRLVRERR